jgi:AcrR family transcriptional regulator
MPPRPRAGLSRERVLRSALDLVDREGVDALSMRRLGRELGVEAMSLYSYVENKQDLIEGVVEQVFREMPLIAPGPGPWAERLRTHASTFREVLLRHPNAVRLVAGRPLVTPGTMAYVESALVELQAYGLDLATADLVLGTIASFVIGSVSEQAGEQARQQAGYARKPGDADAVRYPNVTGITGTATADRDTEFSFGLAVLVTGIECLLAPGESPADAAGGAG